MILDRAFLWLKEQNWEVEVEHGVLQSLRPEIFF